MKYDVSEVCCRWNLVDEDSIGQTIQMDLHFEQVKSRRREESNDVTRSFKTFEFAIICDVLSQRVRSKFMEVGGLRVLGR